MDRLRQALGDEQLTYLGYSYGTTLGSTYAELFPDQVRALVLDAAVDPDVDPLAKAEASAAAFESGFDVYAENCTGLIAGCPLGDDPRGYVEARPGPGRGRADPEQRGGRDAARDPGRRPDRGRRGALRHGLLAAADPGAGRGPRRATPPASSRWPTATPAGSTTTPTRTCSTRTSRSTARTPRRPFEEDEVRDLAAEWDAEYPLFGAGSAIEPLHLHGVGGGADAAARARRRGQRRRSWSSATPATR